MSFEYKLMDLITRYENILGESYLSVIENNNNKLNWETISNSPNITWEIISNISMNLFISMN